jgi:hypothetical protein
MWLIREGTVELTVEGRSTQMEPGSVGFLRDHSLLRSDPPYREGSALVALLRSSRFRAFGVNLATAILHANS